jgi:ribosomal protein S18 acetylase RimI-like enzyme
MRPVIRPAADAAEIAVLGSLIAFSFDHLDANHYLVPQEDERLERMAGFFTLLTEHAAEHGKVLVTEDGAAGAVWFDRTREPVEPVEYERRLKAVAGDFVDRFNALDELFEKHHPTEPHWHLAFLAVHPQRWSQGLGSALMAHTHAELDADGIPAYLESTNADNQRLYRRHGYADMTPFEIYLPDGTPFYRMWRPAGG